MELKGYVWLLGELDSGPKQIKDLQGGHPTSCLKMIQ
jgi:hypothetical protein